MRWLIIIALLGGGGWYGYRHMVSSSHSAAVKAYQTYANALVNDQYAVAMTVAEGQAYTYIAFMEGRHGNARGGGKGGMFANAQKQAINDLRGISMNTDYQIVSNEEKDGTALIEAIQSDYRGDRFAARATRVVQAKHHVTMQNTNGTWKVVNFVETKP